MTIENHHNSTCSALSPFIIGDMEFLLVPNQRAGSEVNVMLITQRRGDITSNQLPLDRIRELAGLFNEAADAAEEMARDDKKWNLKADPFKVVELFERTRN